MGNSEPAETEPLQSGLYKASDIQAMGKSWETVAARATTTGPDRPLGDRAPQATGKGTRSDHGQEAWYPGVKTIEYTGPRSCPYGG